MVWVEVEIWKFGVKIISFFLLYFVSDAIAAIKINILLVLNFDKRSANRPKVALW